MSRLDLMLKLVFLFLGKDEVASSNLAISSWTPKHVVSMGFGVFFLSENCTFKNDLRPHT